MKNPAALRGRCDKRQGNNSTLERRTGRLNAQCGTMRIRQRTRQEAKGAEVENRRARVRPGVRDRIPGCSGEGMRSSGHTVLHRKLDQPGRVLDAQLVYDVAAMHFHRAHADPEPFGAERIRVTAGDELQHLPLAGRQRFAQRRQEQLVGIGLEEVASRACASVVARRCSSEAAASAANRSSTCRSSSSYWRGC